MMMLLVAVLGISFGYIVGSQTKLKTRKKDK
jgi:hypothetical protein